MAKKSPEDWMKELEAENKLIQKTLELVKLRFKAYDTMIDVVEEASTRQRMQIIPGDLLFL